ncbi:MAG: hypothetical protein ABI413_16960 [Ktedonobacteraceae bacterium]
MAVLGYIYSDGSVLCVTHALARGLEDKGNESGEAGGIFRTDEEFYDVVCDVRGCGVIHEKNADDA